MTSNWKRSPATLVSAAVLAILASAVLFSGSVMPPQDDSPPLPRTERPVVIRKSEDGLRFGIRAEDAPMEAVTDRLAAELDWVITLDESVRQQRVTLDIGLREPERLLAVLMRRAGLRLTRRYRLVGPDGSDNEDYAPLPAVFGSERLAVEISRPTSVSQLGPALGINLTVEDSVDRPIRMVYRSKPLREMMAEIARQTGGKWEVAMSAGPAVSAEPDADESERMKAWFSDLAGLSPEDRREEILADVTRIERMSPAEQSQGVARLAADITSMADVLQTVPGEHREQVGGRVLSVASDYYDTLSRLPASRRKRFEPLAATLNSLAGEVRRMVEAP